MVPQLTQISMVSLRHMEALVQLRESGDGLILDQNSWEEEMAALCRSRLSIRPRAGRSVLFYSQLPNGQQDKSSLHGGCPVLSGTKVCLQNYFDCLRPGNALVENFGLHQLTCVPSTFS